MRNGQVKDSTGKPVIGATVLVAGTRIGTVTDTEGKFSLQAGELDNIAVSYMGMKTKVVKVAPKLTVTLEDE
ncbi:MAG: carboxypeptidase-like regulatory domain-containing protein [Bacteroides sp.]|nr:carboxypeptidase-like regulatory domain-containing protein [Bacteroides sp.]